MIIIPEDLEVGEHVYVSFSYGKEKPTESEYKVIEKTPNYVRLGSTSGGFSLFLGKHTIESLNGLVRRT